MGLITELLLLPLAPVRGVTWVAEQVKAEADRQWSDPGAIQAQLADIQALRESGDLGDDDADRLEDDLVQRLLGSTPDQGLRLGDDDG